MPYCSECGKEIKDNARFCRNCGAPVEQEEQRTDAYRPKAEVKKTSVIIVGMICVTAVALAVIGLAFWSLSRRESQSYGESERTAAEQTGVQEEQKEQDFLLFEGETFTLELPLSWEGKYSLETGSDYYAFYNIENNLAGYGGNLFNIEMFGTEGEWEQLPAYQYLDENDGVYYVASFPTDVQFDSLDQERKDNYYEMRDAVEEILETFSFQ